MALRSLLVKKMPAALQQLPPLSFRSPAALQQLPPLSFRSPAAGSRLMSRLQEEQKDYSQEDIDEIDYSQEDIDEMRRDFDETMKKLNRNIAALGGTCGPQAIERFRKELESIYMTSILVFLLGVPAGILLLSRI